MIENPFVLMILDGFGEREESYGNAILNAKTPHLDYYRKNYAFSLISAAGESVGLPNGQIGSSEVGHTNIGAGRIVYQSYMRINHAIEHKKFYTNLTLLNTFKINWENNSAFHIIGLLSDGGVHSHINHFYPIIQMAYENNIKKIFVHAILDGRDTPRKSALNYITEFKNKTKNFGVEIASISGRYYAMDRDERWYRIKKAYLTFRNGKGYKSYSVEKAIKSSYSRGETDEFISPTTIINAYRKPIGLIKNSDTVLFINFRPDRARQLTRAFIDNNFNHFVRNPFPNNQFITMMEYNKDFLCSSIFPQIKLKNCLGEVLSQNNKRQLRLAETEKYAHVTFFLNAQVEQPYPLEDRILVPSLKIKTYNLNPKMCAKEIEKICIKKLNENLYDILIVNLANADMIGHTGIYKACIETIEILDKVIHSIAKKVLEKNGTLLITADHGNIEYIFDENGKPFKAHTQNKVPCFLIGKEYKYKSINDGILADIAPTILDIMKIDQPKEMTGKSLLKK